MKMILNKKRKIILIAVIAAALIAGALVTCLVRMNVKQTVGDETISGDCEMIVNPEITDFILIPKTLIDKIACRNFVRQGEHRKTGCGCPVDTSAKQKHRPNRQVRFCRLSRMFNAA